MTEVSTLQPDCDDETAHIIDEDEAAFRTKLAVIATSAKYRLELLRKLEAR